MKDHWIIRGFSNVEGHEQTICGEGVDGRRMIEWPAYEETGIGFGERDFEIVPVQGPATMTRLLHGRANISPFIRTAWASLLGCSR